MPTCKKILCALLSLMLVMTVASCGAQPKTQKGAAKIIDSKTIELGTDNFFGICNSLYEGEKYGKSEYKKSIEIMKAMGIKSIRLWMHCDFFMSDANTFKEEELALMKQIVADVQAADIEIIGMNHHWFSGSPDTMATPPRDMKDGSPYTKFLLNYDQTWYNIVKTFPEITMWEIGNEWNNDMFLHPYEYKTKGSIYTFSEKVNITTDMLYYGSRGIHRANPKALTVLGGLVYVYETNYGNARNFLKRIYENITGGDYPSTEPDDYFQIVCWHPYAQDSTAGSSDGWAQGNLDIYAVVKEFEGHDKPVIFSEMGFTDYGEESSDAQQAENMKVAIRQIQEKMPFAKRLHWFTMYNDRTAESWGGLKEVYFGLMEEPKEGFFAKAKGKAYQELAGGTGDLDMYRQ